MSDRIEIQGKTVEAAVSEALLRMGARRDEVEIKVLEEPKSGFMGFLGGRAAKVMVRKKRSRGRGGSGRDFRVDDDNYQAHNLSGGRGRGSRRRPSGDSGGSGGSGGSRDRKNEGQEAGREEKSRNRRGSRGRGGRGRNQEAAGRKPAQDQQRDQQKDQQQDRREQPVKAENRDQSGGRSSGGRSRNERGRRSAGDRPKGSADSRRDGRDTNRPARQERVRAEARPEETPSTPVAGGRNQRREAPAPVPAPVQDPAVNITPPEKKEETPVATPKKQRRAFGGLGSRRKGKKVAAKATEVETSTPASSPAAVEPAVAAPMPEAPVQPAVSAATGPVRDYPSDSRGSGRRAPSRRADDYADEVILAGIKGTEYAKAVGEVTDEGLDEALTGLTDGLLARAGFPCRCETLPGEYRQIKVTTDDASAGMLIGRHGQTIDAVEHLVERMASNAIDARARINLDINNYRQRREESLADRVREAAATIRETGRPFHMEPMSARERRLVHMEAADIEGLRTFTMDRAGGKHVVIASDSEAPETAPSTEEQPDYSE